MEIWYYNPNNDEAKRSVLTEGQICEDIARSKAPHSYSTYFFATPEAMAA